MEEIKFDLVQTNEASPILSSNKAGWVQKPQLENTLHNRLEQWKREAWATLAPATCRRYQVLTDFFEEYIAGKPLTPETVAGYTEWLVAVRGLQNKTVNLHVSILVMFLRWCSLHEYTTKDMAVFARHVPQPEPKVPAIFSYQEYIELRDSAIGTDYHWAFILAYHTGLHWVDVCYFRWSSVDLEKMMIRCVRIKLKRHGAKATCWIPIITDSDLHRELLKFYEELKVKPRRPEDEDFICPALAHRYTGSDSSPHASQLERRITKRFPGKTFKTFRNTFASNVTNSGMNMILATKMTGHSDPKSLMIYVRPNQDALREGLEKAFEYGKTNSDQSGISIPRDLIIHGGAAALREDECNEKTTNLKGGKKG